MNSRRLQVAPQSREVTEFSCAVTLKFELTVVTLLSG
jgi:hypothetical protein